jgi:predicted enzyme related to lactoylglutathione lyase
VNSAAAGRPLQSNDPIQPEEYDMTTSAQIISGTDFVSVPTRDLDAAANFYGATLGFTRSMYRPDRHFAEFETGNLTLGVIQAEAMGLEYHPNRNHIALHVDDVQAARAALQERGITFMGDAPRTPENAAP